LKIAYLFLDGIITSTEGSCPISSDKVFPIGQAIDEETFKLKALKPRIDLHRGVHVGRLDPSKNLEIIFTSVSSLRKTFPELSITQIGSPSTSFAKSESDLLRIKWDAAIKEGWISIEGSITRAKLPLLFNNYDVFFHAYIGSLDKSLIEATMSGLPVVTINPEYLLEFGSWGNDSNPSIVKEYESLLGMDSVHYAEEIQRRYKIALGKHSKSRWIDSLVSLLTGVEETSGRSDN
jgi:glycosyltransferase involved in cell wall biosynthesis